MTCVLWATMTASVTLTVRELLPAVVTKSCSLISYLKNVPQENNYDSEEKRQYWLRKSLILRFFFCSWRSHFLRKRCSIPSCEYYGKETRLGKMNNYKLRKELLYHPHFHWWSDRTAGNLTHLLSFVQHSLSLPARPLQTPLSYSFPYLYPFPYCRFFPIGIKNERI